MREFKDILIGLMKEKNCYSEKEIQDKIQNSSFDITEEDAMLNLGHDKKYFTFAEVQVEIAKEVFQKHFESKKEFDNFVNSLKPKSLGRFFDLSHFYYFWCKRPKIDENLDESFKLIVMTSIIESLMTGGRHKDFFSWFLGKYKLGKIETASGLDLKKEMSSLWNEYTKLYGARKTVLRFFEKYIDKNTQQRLSESFIYIETQKHPNITEIASLLYVLRSKFVHNAETVQLGKKAPEGSAYLLINGKALKISTSIDRILDRFEEGFLNFFKENNNE